jgi:hypothetical protein
VKSDSGSHGQEEGTQFSHRGPRQFNYSGDANADRKSGSARKVAVVVVTLNITESVATLKLDVFLTECFKNATSYVKWNDTHASSH